MQTASAILANYDSVRARLWGRQPFTAPAPVKAKRPPIFYPGRLREYPSPIGPVRPSRSGVHMRAIIRAVSCEYGVEASDITGARRLQAFVTPRHVAYYIARRMTGKSFPLIGKAFGGKDHTTILYGVGKVEAQYQSDEAFRARVNSIIAAVRASA